MKRIAHAALTALIGAMPLTGCCLPALAEDGIRAAQPGDAAARALADEVLGKAGVTDGEDLDAWARTVMDRALKRSGEAASEASGAAAAAGSAEPSPAPLPAERQAAGLTARRATADVLVFMSLAVPSASWRQWTHEASRVGAPLILRGIGNDGLRAFARRIRGRIGDAGAGVAVDPRLFRLFGIDRVPAVVVVPGGVAPCTSRRCAEDPAPLHDLVTGNVGLVAALETVAAEGEAGRDAAERILQRFRGGKR